MGKGERQRLPRAGPPQGRVVPLGRKHLPRTQQHTAAGARAGPGGQGRHPHHERRQARDTRGTRHETKDGGHRARRERHRAHGLHRACRGGGGQQPRKGIAQGRTARSHPHTERDNQADTSPRNRLAGELPLPGPSGFHTGQGVIGGKAEGHGTHRGRPSATGLDTRHPSPSSAETGRRSGAPGHHAHAQATAAHHLRPQRRRQVRLPEDRRIAAIHVAVRTERARGRAEQDGRVPGHHDRHRRRAEPGGRPEHLFLPLAQHEADDERLRRAQPHTH